MPFESQTILTDETITFAEGNFWRADLATLSNDTHVVIFVQRDNPEQLMAQFMNSQGELLGDPIILIEEDSRLRNGKVIGLEDGGFVTVWIAESEVQGVYNTYAEIFDNRGNTIVERFVLSEGNSGAIALEATEDNGFIYAWQDGRGGGDAINITSYSSTGIVEHGPLSIAEGHRPLNLEIDQLLNGDLAITWYVQDEDATYTVYGAVVNQNLSTFSDIFEVGSGDQQYGPDITSLQGGGLCNYLVWAS